MPRLLRLQLQPDPRLGDSLISVGGFFSSLPYQPHSFTNHNKPTLVSTLTVRVATPRGVISPPPVVTSRLRSSMWLQFKPHQIAAGAAYLAAKFLNMNLASCNDVWHEFQTPPSVLRDVAHQLMELF